MADWTSIPDATFDPDRPVLGSTHLAIVKNFEALVEGAAGAPRITLGAMDPNDATDFQEFLVSGTWTKPTGASIFYVEVIAGGASGPAARNVETQLAGGSGGLSIFNVFRGADVGSTVTVTVGAGGAAVVRTANGISGGNAGGNSSFGSLLVASDFNAGAGSFRGFGVAGAIGQSTIYGGAAGGGVTAVSGGGVTAFAGGTSVVHGNGGAGGFLTGVAGTAFGGGGGAAAGSVGGGGTITSGAGAAGRVRIWSW